MSLKFRLQMTNKIIHTQKRKLFESLSTIRNELNHVFDTILYPICIELFQVEWNQERDNRVIKFWQKRVRSHRLCFSYDIILIKPKEIISLEIFVRNSRFNETKFQKLIINIFDQTIELGVNWNYSNYLKSGHKNQRKFWSSYSLIETLFFKSTNNRIPTTFVTIITYYLNRLCI